MGPLASHSDGSPLREGSVSESLLGVLNSDLGQERKLPRLEFDRLRKSPLKPHEQVAVNFAMALVAGHYERARDFLTPALRLEWSAERLRASFTAMFSGYSTGRPRRIHFEPGFSHDDWPDKRSHDLGWVYVAIEGDDFNEAVSVIVAKSDGRALIREIEWGRP